MTVLVNSRPEYKNQSTVVILYFGAAEFSPHEERDHQNLRLSVGAGKSRGMSFRRRKRGLVDTAMWPATVQVCENSNREWGI